MPNFIIHIIFSALLVAGIYYYEKKFKKNKEPNIKIIALLVFASNLIDLDHLLADPIYDIERCSINFHPLHSWYVFPFYFLGLFWKKYSYLFMGIILHLILDGIDCLI